jgi:ankyrin repeat protein
VLADGCHFRSPETFDYAGSGLYPLHLAVASGSTATVQVLAEAGFNVHHRNASGATPIGAAVQTGQLDLVEVRATPNRNLPSVCLIK